MSEFAQYSTEQLKDLARKALADPKAPEGLAESIITELMERDKPSFGEAVTGITERRLENIAETVEEPQYLISGMNPVARIAGKELIGGASEIVGEAVDRIMPDFVEEGISAGLDYLANTDFGKSFIKVASQGMEAVEEWKQQSPRNKQLVDEVEAMFNIATLTAPHSKIATAVPDVGEQISTKGNSLIKNSKTDLFAKNKQSIAKYLAPKINNNNIDNFVKSRMGSVKWDPNDKKTSEALDWLVNSKEFSTKTYIWDQTKILQEEFNKLDNKLLTGLSKSKIKIKARDVLKELDENIQEVFGEYDWKQKEKYRLALRGYDAMVQKVRKTNNPDEEIDLISLLKARRELDKEGTFGNKDAIYDKGEKTANQEIRNVFASTIHDIIDRNSPDSQLKEILKEESKILTAKKLVSNKLIEDVESWSQGAVKRLRRHISLTGPGIAGAVAAASTVATGGLTPFLTNNLTIAAGLTAAVGTLTYAGTKVLMAPTTKKYFGKAVKLFGDAIETAEKSGSKELVDQLKADRLIIIDLIQNSEVKEEEEKEEKEIN
tara:strand:- start:182 stop:1825 length:1644 start_codon:yes stop_codon:yes gene_type:complete